MFHSLGYIVTIPLIIGVVLAILILWWASGQTGKKFWFNFVVTPSLVLWLCIGAGQLIRKPLLRQDTLKVLRTTTVRKTYPLESLGNNNNGEIMWATTNKKLFHVVVAQNKQSIPYQIPLDKVTQLDSQQKTLTVAYLTYKFDWTKVTKDQYINRYGIAAYNALTKLKQTKWQYVYVVRVPTQDIN